MKNLFCLFLLLGLPATVLSRTLLVVAGGYQTCPTSTELLPLPHGPSIATIIRSASGLIQALKSQDPEVDVIWSCYSGLLAKTSLTHMAADGPMSFRYGFLGPRGPEQTGFLPISAVQLDGGRPIRAFFDFVRHYVEASSPSHIYLTGHSYGGWTALQLGVRLIADGRALAGTMLIDPISPFQCSANVLTFSVLSFAKAPEGCLKAPRDMLHRDMEDLARNSGWQLNIYQTQLSFLHSGPMTYGGWQNQQIQSFSHYTPFGDVHTALATDPRVWKKGTAFLSCSKSKG